MSEIRIQQLSAFSQSFGNIVDSSLDATKAYVNSQYNRISDQVTLDYNAFLSELEYSNDFEDYENKVNQFWEQESSKIRDGGYGSVATQLYMEKAMPGLQQRMQTSAKEMMVNGYWNQAVNNYSLDVNNIMNDGSLTYDQKVQKIKDRYESDNMANLPLKIGRVKKPEELFPQIKEASIAQAFGEIPVLQYADSYYYDGVTPEEIFSQMKGSSGISDWTEQEEASAVSQIEKSLSAIDKRQRLEAGYAQDAIVTDMRTRRLNGEIPTANDVINSAIEAGALRENGDVRREWATFLDPYVEQYLKDRTIAEASAKYTLEEKGVTITPEDIVNVASKVSSGTFTFKVSGEESQEAGGRRSLPAVQKFDKMVDISDNVSVDTDGKVVVNDEDTGATAVGFTDGSVIAVSEEPVDGLDGYLVKSPGAEATAEADRIVERMRAMDRNYVFDESTMGEDEAGSYWRNPVSIGDQSYVYELKGADRKGPFIADYTPEAGTPGEGMSEELAEIAGIRDSLQGSDIANIYNSDGSFNYDNLRGKATYKYKEDEIKSEYAPLVKALCEEYGIPYDPESKATYDIADLVQQCADAGAFTDPNKAMAVTTLATMRLDPSVTPNRYDSYLMYYMGTAVLSDAEIKDYGLEKSAFDGGIDTKTYGNALNQAYKLAFKSLYNKTYSSDNETKLSIDDSNNWYTVKERLDKALTQAWQLDPLGAEKDSLTIVQDAVDRVIDNTLAEKLYKDLTSKHQNVVTFDWNNYQVGSGSLSWNIPQMLTNLRNDAVLSMYSARRPDETDTASGVLQTFFSTMGSDDWRYADHLSNDVLRYIDEKIYNPATTDTYTSPSDNRKNLNAIAKDLYGVKNYDALTKDQKETVSFSYLYGMTNKALMNNVCRTFGYDKSDIAGNVVVAPVEGMGGGMAMVTSDGRVFMSGGIPDGSGHQWIIGSVSSRTLANIQSGITTISYAEISRNGIMNFSDDNLLYEASGQVVSRRNRNDKSSELLEIYRTVQPDRYNIIDLNKGIRSN